METISSVLNQTKQPDEIIVVDDHSTDGTVDYLESLKLQNVKVVSNAGKGPGAARNTGLKVAHGDYIKFFDSDDLMSLNTIETQLDLLELSGEDIVYSPYVHAAFENGHWIQKDVVLQYYPIPRKMTLRDCMAYGFFTVIPAMMFRRDFLSKIGAWREDIVAYEDWDYLWRISEYVKIPMHTTDCFMVYRVHGKQITQEYFDNIQRDTDKLSCLAEVLKDPSINQRQKLFIESELYKTKSSVAKDEILNIKYRIILFWKRMRNKRERIITNTNWERMHGALNQFDCIDFNNLCWISKN